MIEQFIYVINTKNYDCRVDNDSIYLIHML